METITYATFLAAQFSDRLVFAGMKRSLLLLQPNHCQMTTTT
jgi:hypothetical protein